MIWAGLCRPITETDVARELVVVCCASGAVSTNIFPVVVGALNAGAMLLSFVLTGRAPPLHTALWFELGNLVVVAFWLGFVADLPVREFVTEWLSQTPEGEAGSQPRSTA